jgi:galactose mutarotase-like enzyme
MEVRAGCRIMCTMATAPTGAQHEIVRGEQVAVVTELGATLRSYDVAGRPVLDGFPANVRPDGGRGQVLAPWPNRVADGRYTFGGEQLQLALSEVPKRNAIHGLVRWVGWDLAERGDDWATLTTAVWPQPGYPFLLRLRATYRLHQDGLQVRLGAVNDGDRPAPYGVGQHPYVTVGVPVDDTLLTVPAEQRLLTDDRGNPVGTEAVAGTAYDFRSARAVGDLELDTAYFALQRGSDGRAVVRLDDPAGGPGVAVWLGEGARHLQVFSGDTLPDPARRRRGLAVEPMSCPPGAFASGTDLVVLDPGDGHELTWGVHSG